MFRTDEVLSTTTESSSVYSESQYSDTRVVLENNARVRTLKKRRNRNINKNVIQHVRINPLASTFSPITQPQLTEWLRETGHISIQNASEPIIGQQNNYNGPVTIQQFFSAGVQPKTPRLQPTNTRFQQYGRSGVRYMDYYNESSELCTDKRGNINSNLLI